MKYSDEIENLISAWMEREDMPVPVLVKRTPNEKAVPLGKHDLAIVAVHDRRGKDSVEGAYLLCCDDDEKLRRLEGEIDGLNDRLLRGETTDVITPRNRLLGYFNNQN